jgi:hypothetical protein
MQKDYHKVKEKSPPGQGFFYREDSPLLSAEKEVALAALLLCCFLFLLCHNVATFVFLTYLNIVRPCARVVRGRHQVQCSMLYLLVSSK